MLARRYPTQGAAKEEYDRFGEWAASSDLCLSYFGLSLSDDTRRIIVVDLSGQAGEFDWKGEGEMLDDSLAALALRCVNLPFEGAGRKLRSDIRPAPRSPNARMVRGSFQGFTSRSLPRSPLTRRGSAAQTLATPLLGDSRQRVAQLAER